MKTFAFVLIFVSSIVNLSCTDELSSSSNDQQFYPLKVGNYWKYKITSKDSSFQPGYSVKTEIVQKDSLIRNAKWYFIALDIEGIGVYGGRYYVNMNRGLCKTSGSDTSEILYKYPCAKNDLYYSSGINDTTKVIDVDVLVISQLGSFKCIVYQKVLTPTDGATLYTNIFVSKGVGVIKEEYFVFTSSTEIKIISSWDLVDYKIN